MKKFNAFLSLTSLLLLSGCTNDASSKLSGSSKNEDSSSSETSSRIEESSSESSSNESSSKRESSSNSDPVSEFRVNVIENNDIEITGLKESYQTSEKVVFHIVIKNDKKEISIVKVNGTIVDKNADGSYSFFMPNEDVAIEVTLKDKKEEIQVATNYAVLYELPGKSAKKLDTNSDVFNCFVKTREFDGLINSVSSFENLYGGANGRTESVWYIGDVLKFGTTSVNGSITFDLKYEINKIKISGYTYDVNSKLQIGDSNSVDFGGESESKTTTIVNSTMEEICKSVVDAKKVTSVEISFDSTKSLRIDTLNKKPLFLTQIEFYLSSTVPTNFYTVTWKNYDDSILKVDNNIPEGTLPAYKGETPIKPDEGENIYKFIGWDPEISKIYEDTTYVAKFKEIAITNPEGDFSPTFTSDGNKVLYGFYPKSHINDQNLINQLEATTTLTPNGYFVLNNEFYTKIEANVFANEDYYFNDGSKISSGTSYWFKCENITWKIISRENNKYTLLSEDLLDANCFYSNYKERTINNEPVYANSYFYSDIRNWLNTSFLDNAFNFDSTYIIESEVDNGPSSTDSVSNPYISVNSTDKVYLLSYKDYLNQDYGFSEEERATSLREAKTTDYTRAKGAWYNKGNNKASLKFNGTYWTRSPSSEYSYTAKNINSAGVISDYAVDGTSHCVRPSITISL